MAWNIGEAMEVVSECGGASEAMEMGIGEAQNGEWGLAKAR